MGIFLTFSKLKKFMKTIAFPSSKYSTIIDDSSNNLVKNLWNCDFCSPIKDTLNRGGAQALDVGTGKGAWVIEMAQKYPQATFYGVDAAFYFPPVPRVGLMNAHFLQSDILETLVFEDNTFEFVHLRCITLIFTDQEWRSKVLKELIRVCKPGSWIEIVELDCQYINQGPTHAKLCESSKKFYTENGVFAIAGENIVYYAKQTGLVCDINEEIKVVPFHGSKLGRAFADHQIKFMQAYKDVLSNYMGLDLDEWDETIKTIRRELTEYKTESIMRRITFRKNFPENSSGSYN